MPAYVYDLFGVGTTVTNITFYEQPVAQNVGVFSPTAAAILPQLQALPGFPANSITGLTMSNSSPATALSIAAGQAADSTNSILINLTTPCTADLSVSGLNGLDTGTVASNKTYYFFLIADSTGANAPSCVASKNTSPTFGTSPPLSNYNLYRAVGIMYTEPASTSITPFTQIDDTFYLTASAQFAPTVGTIALPALVGSVPGMTSVDMFGRCSGGSNTMLENVMLTSGVASAQAPSSLLFSTNPGYAVNATSPNTAFSFSLYTAPVGTTAPGGTIWAQASGPATLYCYNDGWIWHRGK